VIKRILKFLAVIRFSNPKKNDVVILYDDYWLKKLVLRDIDSTTIKCYPDTIHLTPTLVVRTLFHIEKNDWIQVLTNGSVKSFISKAYLRYILSCIDLTQAKVVLTFIDNSGLFWSLSRIDTKRTYYAIQNGARTTACVRDSLPLPPHRNAIISMPYFFCFGQRDIDLFTRYRHRIDNYYPVGSLIGGYYKSSVLSEQKICFDLCFISQWHAHFFCEIVGDDFCSKEWKRVRAGLDKLNCFLLKFIEETGLNLIICPRNDNDADEIAFYRNIYGDKASISEANRKDFSTYRIIDRSRLAIALNSTTLSEVFAWGKKVLWCNMTDDEHFEMPEAGVSYFHCDDYDAFKERLLLLLAMPQDKYESVTCRDARYINNFNPDNPPHEVIRSRIMNILSEPH